MSRETNNKKLIAKNNSNRLVIRQIKNNNPAACTEFLTKLTPSAPIRSNQIKTGIDKSNMAISVTSPVGNVPYFSSSSQTQPVGSVPLDSFGGEEIRLRTPQASMAQQIYNKQEEAAQLLVKMAGGPEAIQKMV